MFDIVSYIREKIFRRPTLATPVAGEELSEKQTTKLGYFLLYCMFGAILMSAQWTLSIIEGIPERPTAIPICVTSMVSNFEEKNIDDLYYRSYNYNSSYNDCALTSTKPTFDFTVEYNSLVAPSEEINKHETTIQELQSKKQEAQYSQKNSQQDYNTSLAEKTANENS